LAILRNTTHLQATNQQFTGYTSFLAIVYWIVANDQHMLSTLTWFCRRCASFTSVDWSHLTKHTWFFHNLCAGAAGCLPAT